MQPPFTFWRQLIVPGLYTQFAFYERIRGVGYSDEEDDEDDYSQEEDGYDVVPSHSTKMQGWCFPLLHPVR